MPGEVLDTWEAPPAASRPVLVVIGQGMTSVSPAESCLNNIYLQALHRSRDLDRPSLSPGPSAPSEQGTRGGVRPGQQRG